MLTFQRCFQVNFSGLFEVLSVLLEWTSESHLQRVPTFQDSPQGRLQEQQLDFPSALVHEKCLKVRLDKQKVYVLALN